MYSLAYYLRSEWTSSFLTRLLEPVTLQWAKLSTEAAGAALVHSIPRTGEVWTASSRSSWPVLTLTRDSWPLGLPTASWGGS